MTTLNDIIQKKLRQFDQTWEDIIGMLLLLYAQSKETLKAEEYEAAIREHVKAMLSTAMREAAEEMSGVVMPKGHGLGTHTEIFRDGWNHCHAELEKNLQKFLSAKMTCLEEKSTN